MEGYSLSPETHIGHAHLQIAEGDRALAFYQDLLGFRLISRQAGIISLSASGDYPAHILITPYPQARPKPARTSGLYHIAIRLPDRQALALLFQRLLERNYPFQGFSDHKVSEALYLADPDGNGLELYADRPRELWPVSDDQIAMATDPLDVRDLLSQAPAEEWSGIHPSTDIGHVHLHVADLEQTEQFYRHLLGFDVTQRGYPGALFLSAGGYHHHIGANIWAGKGAPAPPADAVGLLSFSIRIPDGRDLVALLERIRSANVPIEAAREYQDALGFLVRDPSQNGVELLVARDGVDPKTLSPFYSSQ